MASTKIQFYNHNFLDQMRQTGDLAADKLIAEIFDSEQAVAFHQLLKTLTHNHQLEEDSLPTLLKKFVADHLQMPQWADESQINQGAKVFQHYAEPILMMLGFLSLPYCYAAADGAEVLLKSARIRNDTRRRLLETAQFVLDVMHPKAFRQEGKALASILKVRLMHATVRYHLLKSKTWDKNLGVPVNQEDMGGTNGAFSWISLRGLRKIGFVLSQKESNAFLHRWNVIGCLLGVREELLPDSAKEAFWLDAKIAERQFKKSDAGIALTQSLRDCLMNDAKRPLPVGFTDTYMRFLLGDKVADLLEIPPSNWTSSLITPLKLQNIFARRPSPSSKNEGDMYMMIEEEVLKDPVSFAFPLSLG